jgi:hypothetical protein
MSIDALFHIIVEITFLFIDSNNQSHTKTIQDTAISDLGFYYWDRYDDDPRDYDEIIVEIYNIKHPLSNGILYENNDYTRIVKKIGYTDKEYDEYINNTVEHEYGTTHKSGYYSPYTRTEEYENFRSRNFYLIPKSIETAFLKEYIRALENNEKEYAEFIKQNFINDSHEYFYHTKLGNLIGTHKPNKNIVKIETKMINQW